MALIKSEERLAPQIDQPAADQSDDAHPQRWGEAVPKSQVVLRRRSLQDASDRHGQNGLNGQGRQNAYQ